MAIFILGPDPNGNCCECDGRANPCVSCGEPPAGCQCAMIVPVFNLPPITYAEAVDNINNVIVDCISYAPGSVDYAPGSVTADTSIPDELTIDADFTEVIGPTEVLSLSVYNSITVAANSVLTIDWNIPSRQSGSCAYYIYECTYTFSSGLVEVYTITTDTGNHSFTALPEGTYVVIFVATSALGENHFLASCTTTSSDTMVVNPAICKWDDSGTTRDLEACPKLLLPPLTEDTEDWYVDSTEAQTAITDQTSNCAGYVFDPPSAYGALVFEATDGGTTLTLFAEATSDVGVDPDRVRMMGSVNALEGETLTLDWDYLAQSTSVPSVGSVDLIVYSYEGTVLYADSIGGIVVDSTSGSFTTPALPYNGRYTVVILAVSRYAVDPDPETLTVTLEVTSSGTMSVNPVQALYTRGLDCPARLDCS